MRAILFVNGTYSCYTRYEKWIQSADCIVCVDGGANQAYEWNVKADHLIGDFDSIRPEVLAYYQNTSTKIQSFPPEKDATDTQLALQFLLELGADEMILLGSMGGRPDHSFSNLLTTLPFVRQGVKILHIDTECQIWVTQSDLQIEGKPGDIVSVFSLTEQSQGVTLEGFQYPLDQADLYWDHPYAISNVLLGNRGRISLQQGILAVMHFQ